MCGEDVRGTLWAEGEKATSAALEEEEEQKGEKKKLFQTQYWKTVCQILTYHSSPAQLSLKLVKRS